MAVSRRLPDLAGAQAVSAGEALDALAGSVRDLALARSMVDIQRLATSAARRLTAADGAALALREDGEFRYVGEDAIEPLWNGRRLPLGECICGWSMLNGRPASIEDIYADDRVSHEAYRTTFVKSLMVVPIRQRESLGSIGIYWARRHRASKPELDLACALADSTAAAIERILTEAELVRLTQENARLSRAVERQRHIEEDLRELCERDALTGLLNRRAWDQALGGALRKGAQPLYVGLIDLDHFKAYNDRHGHPAGDALLRRAAHSWRAVLRSGDILARYGGEEFAVLLSGCEPDRALHIAERLREATADERSASIGVARWNGTESAACLVKRADRALYDAKHAGRNRVMFSA